MAAPADIVTHQHVILARLSDFCRYGERVGHYEREPWLYMRGKLEELEGPVRSLKQGQLDSARDRFLENLRAGPVGDEALAEFKGILHAYLAPGDFVDISFQLEPQALNAAGRRDEAVRPLRNAKACCLFDEERRPEEKQSRSYRKLIEELWSRLGLDACERALNRKPRTARRKRMVLRRMRFNVAEYCAVLHMPTSAEDTFSPFLLPRVEALIVACLRLLKRIW